MYQAQKNCQDDITFLEQRGDHCACWNDDKPIYHRSQLIKKLKSNNSHEESIDRVTVCPKA